MAGERIPESAVELLEQYADLSSSLNLRMPMADLSGRISGLSIDSTDRHPNFARAIRFSRRLELVKVTASTEKTKRCLQQTLRWLNEQLE